MSNENKNNKEIGLRIRTARKEKGINQTELAELVGKSLRTIQKYESGEIEVSIAMINEISKILECESTYLIGYDSHSNKLSDFADILNFFCQLERIKDIHFEVETKRPPHHDGWECSIKFNGKDKSAELNQDICLFLEEFENHREEYLCYKTDYENFKKWQEKTLAYHSGIVLEEKEIEELSQEERIKRFQAIMNERYGKK